MFLFVSVSKYQSQQVNTRHNRYKKTNRKKCRINFGSDSISWLHCEPSFSSLDSVILSERRNSCDIRIANTQHHALQTTNYRQLYNWLLVMRTRCVVYRSSGTKWLSLCFMCDRNARTATTTSKYCFSESNQIISRGIIRLGSQWIRLVNISSNKAETTNKINKRVRAIQDDATVIVSDKVLTICWHLIEIGRFIIQTKNIFRAPFVYCLHSHDQDFVATKCWNRSSLNGSHKTNEIEAMWWCNVRTNEIRCCRTSSKTSNLLQRTNFGDDETFLWRRFCANSCASPFFVFVACSRVKMNFYIFTVNSRRADSFWHLHSLMDFLAVVSSARPILFEYFRRSPSSRIVFFVSNEAKTFQLRKVINAKNKPLDAMPLSRHSAASYRQCEFRT